MSSRRTRSSCGRAAARSSRRIRGALSAPFAARSSPIASGCPCQSITSRAPPASRRKSLTHGLLVAHSRPAPSRLIGGIRRNSASRRTSPCARRHAARSASGRPGVTSERWMSCRSQLGRRGGGGGHRAPRACALGPPHTRGVRGARRRYLRCAHQGRARPARQGPAGRGAGHHRRPTQAEPVHGGRFRKRLPPRPTTPPPGGAWLSACRRCRPRPAGCHDRKPGVDRACVAFQECRSLRPRRRRRRRRPPRGRRASP